MMVGRWVSFWDCLFLGAMLNFGVYLSVNIIHVFSLIFTKTCHYDRTGIITWFHFSDQSLPQKFHAQTSDLLDVWEFPPSNSKHHFRLGETESNKKVMPVEIYESWVCKWIFFFELRPSGSIKGGLRVAKASVKIARNHSKLDSKQKWN